jgi:enoyl-CoA hydratase
MGPPAMSPPAMGTRYRGLLIERHGPVGWLIFNRPQVGNAMDAGMLADLPRAWQALDADPEVRVIVNTGGGNAFQTGLDVVQLARDPDALRDMSRRTKRADLGLTGWHNKVGKPVIAAVNGTCAGGGLHFVCDADIVIAAQDATFLDPHVSVGQASAFELVGLARKGAFEPVMRLGLTGRHERLDAARALRLGLVSQLTPKDQLRDAAQELAEKIARNPSDALRLVKRLLWTSLELGLAEARRQAAVALTQAPLHPVPADSPRPAEGESEGQSATPGDWPPSARGGGNDSPPRRKQPSNSFELPGEHAVTYTEYETLRLERRGKVGWLFFNRPEALNAMSSRMREELADAWLELDRDPEVHVIVNTGEGRAFQTGVDLAELSSDGIGMERYRESVERNELHFTAWHQKVTKPVIAAVNGICAGAGFHWVADADVVIAATTAEFTDPHVSVGQVVAMEAIGLLRKMPFEAVMRMALVGKYERMPAQRAYDLGMVSQLTEPERLRDVAQELAERIARNSPAAMAATKRALWGALETGLTDACRLGGRELVSVWGHPDQDEGPRAWAEKRDPRWLAPQRREPAGPRGAAEPEGAARPEGTTRPEVATRLRGATGPEGTTGPEVATRPRGATRPEGAAGPQEPIQAQKPVQPDGPVQAQEPVQSREATR